MSDLAKRIWNLHIDVFQHFDLVCHNGDSLEEETKSNALFNALVTLNEMENSQEVDQAIQYLKGTIYYSHINDNDY